MHVVLCKREREGKKNPVCMPLPGRALQGFGYECVTACMYVRILEKLLWEAVYLHCMAKSFC